MTREQIEKAARIERENVHKELQENYRKHKDINHYTAFSATIDMYAVPLFKAGAQWRINSVWHDRTEKADTSKELILMYSNGSIRVTLLNPNLTFDGFLSVDMFIKWAYVSDILPEIKEETE